MRFAGVITTPGVAYLTRTGDFAAGVMISASHNPYADNGIKVFARTGYKLPDAEEHEIEEEIFRIPLPRRRWHEPSMRGRIWIFCCRRFKCLSKDVE